MTPTAFLEWLAAMRAAGLARSDKDCAELLGVTPTGLLRMKKKGTTRQTALACRALYHNMEPWC
ncbi:MAG: hypothetical protein CL535_16450 [Ahrensia sp.]|nr:hypothetical protein [Ahrensia sp.]MBV48164.1 hypothetical protein [Roseobacter sp.]MBV48265.1 hypothetical protein [Roseobacter sp.]